MHQKKNSNLETEKNKEGSEGIFVENSIFRRTIQKVVKYTSQQPCNITHDSLLRGHFQNQISHDQMYSKKLNHT